MDGPALSGRERRLLDEIECELRQDVRLDRRLSTMGAKRPNRFLGLLRRVPPGIALALAALTVFCASVGARTPTAAVLTAVVAVWAVGLAVATGVTVALRRRSRPAAPGRRPRQRERRPWEDREDREYRGDWGDREDPPERS